MYIVQQNHLIPRAYTFTKAIMLTNKSILSVNRPFEQQICCQNFILKNHFTESRTCPSDQEALGTLVKVSPYWEGYFDGKLQNSVQMFTKNGILTTHQVFLSGTNVCCG